MNREDPFEERLRRQPVREIPPAWREEILAAAAGCERPRAALRQGLFSWAGRIRLREWLWPAPQAWAGLAALWMIILGLHFTSREPATRDYASQTGPASPQMRELLRQQEEMLAELVGPLDRPESERPRPPAPQPRSQRRGETMNA